MSGTRQRPKALTSSFPCQEWTAPRNFSTQGLIARSLLEDAEKAYQTALNKQMAAETCPSPARDRPQAQVAQVRAASNGRTRPRTPPS
jgi:hypothetical protein